MPKRLEDRLFREARKAGFGKKRTNAYVYGTLRHLGYPVGRKRGATKGNRKGKRR